MKNYHLWCNKHLSTYVTKVNQRQNKVTKRESIIFYNKYKGLLYNSSFRILGNSLDAEEVTQDTILKYLRFPKSLSIEQERAWLVKAAIRASIDIIRKKRSESSFLEGYKEFESNKELEAKGEMLWGELKESKSELVQKITKGLKELPDGYRTILSMILFEGYDYEEAAQVLNIKEATVRSQYMRGKIKLAEIVKQY